MASTLYATFMRGRPSPRRTFTAMGLGLNPTSHSKRLLMDVIFIAAGIGLFAAFAGYAALLGRL